MVLSLRKYIVLRARNEKTFVFLSETAFVSPFFVFSRDQESFMLLIALMLMTLLGSTERRLSCLRLLQITRIP